MNIFQKIYKLLIFLSVIFQLQANEYRRAIIINGFDKTIVSKAEKVGAMVYILSHAIMSESAPNKTSVSKEVKMITKFDDNNYFEIVQHLGRPNVLLFKLIDNQVIENTYKPLYLNVLPTLIKQRDKIYKKAENMWNILEKKKELLGE
ncbi:hypothetical protein M1446_05110 [Candidatus Dependentiae bacterium]|nr:hypothetical protein [Candidatus Dependentiae bacterium]